MMRFGKKIQTRIPTILYDKLLDIQALILKKTGIKVKEALIVRYIVCNALLSDVKIADKIASEVNEWSEKL